MLTSLLSIGLVALTSSVSAQFGPTLNGGQCPYEGWLNCKFQGAWGCVQLEGPNCVDQTVQCDFACGSIGARYAYQKDQSDDRTCVCSNDDASLPAGFIPPPPNPVLTGGQCDYGGLRHCQQDQGAWGCVLIDGGGPNCVDQTKQCDAACGFRGYAYQKDMSDDLTCICTTEDASQVGGFFKREFQA